MDMHMVITGVDRRPFQEGQEVVLDNGTYCGTLGVFIRLKDDVNWAEIQEQNGAVRSHPVTWMKHYVRQQAVKN